MKRIGSALLWLSLFAPLFVSAQIDPVRRDLIQLGYNRRSKATRRSPVTPFIITTSRIFCARISRCGWRVAPVYLDSELGFVNGLGPNTDFAIGLAGGGFADSYNEIRGGTYYPGESFDGHGAEISASIYHLFNPGDRDSAELRSARHGALFDL